MTKKLNHEVRYTRGLPNETETLVAAFLCAGDAYAYGVKLAADLTSESPTSVRTRPGARVYVYRGAKLQFAFDASPREPVSAS